jgi:isocitrate/isopropylmalate dehydrogenase
MLLNVMGKIGGERGGRMTGPRRRLREGNVYLRQDFKIFINIRYNISRGSLKFSLAEYNGKFRNSFCKNELGFKAFLIKKIRSA